MEKINNIKAICFDLDGVLADFTEFHYLALNSALKNHGFDCITEREHKYIFNGLPTKEKLRILAEGMSRIPEDRRLHNQIDATKQKYTIEIAKQYLNPDKGKIEMMEYIKNKDIRICCCSNSIRASVTFFLDKLNLAKYMEFIIGNDDVLNPKPAPDMYLRAFENLNLQPKECLIIEDSPKGQQAAEKSGGILVKVKGYNDVNKKLFTDLNIWP